MKRHLIVSLGLLLVLLLTATASFAVEYHEAPMLRVKVAAGELPPVEERLPEEPVIIEPVEEIGQYGGTWNRAWLGMGDKWGPEKILREGLMTAPVMGSTYRPNIARSWDISEGGRVYTFHLTKGIKWSDGYPFTADDIMFWYEDLILNKELTASVPGWLTIGGEAGKLEKVDEYTIRFTFSQPYGMFLSELNAQPIYAPKHYMRQFHPRYVSVDKLEELTKEAGFDFWYQLFSSKGARAEAWFVTNPDHPTLGPWIVTVPPPAMQMVHERNPYYWKVDPEGNQLPYIDYIVHDTVEDSQILAFKAMAGEIDMIQRHMNLSDYTLYMENRERGDYRVFKYLQDTGSMPSIMPNLTCKDLVLRKLFQDPQFRKALSLAINRQEINEIVLHGLGEPRQASILPGGYLYSEEWEKAYAEYDPEKANAFLDEIGLTERDKEGFRLRSDGKTLTVIIEFTEVLPGASDTVPLVKEYWEAIGIKVTIKSLDRSLYMVRGDSNDLQVAIWAFPGWNVAGANGSYIIPTVPSAYDRWGAEYGRYYATGGKAGVKPPADIARLQEIWDELKSTVDEKKKDQLADEVNQLHMKNIWVIGTVGGYFIPVIVKNNFRNVPERVFADPAIPDCLDPEQFFIRQK